MLVGAVTCARVFVCGCQPGKGCFNDRCLEFLSCSMSNHVGNRSTCKAMRSSSGRPLRALSDLRVPVRLLRVNKSSWQRQPLSIVGLRARTPNHVACQDLICTLEGGRSDIERITITLWKRTRALYFESRPYFFGV